MNPEAKQSKKEDEAGKTTESETMETETMETETIESETMETNTEEQKMNPEAKQLTEEEKAEKRNDAHDMKNRAFLMREEYWDKQIDLERRTNMHLYRLATSEAEDRFCYLFKELVTKYQRPVKKDLARRPLPKDALIKIILDELNVLGIIRKEFVKDDPDDKYIVRPYNNDLAEEGDKHPMFKRQEQNKIAEYEENILSQERPKLRNFGIDPEESSIDSDWEKTHITRRVDKFPNLKKALISLDIDKIEKIDNMVHLIFGKDLENIKTSQQTPKKELEEVDTTSVQTSTSLTVSGVKRTSSNIESSELSTPELSMPEISEERGVVTSPRPVLTEERGSVMSRGQVSKKQATSKSPSATSTSVGLSQTKQKTPKYAHVKSTIPKPSSATKKPPSATKKSPSPTKKPK